MASFCVILWSIWENRNALVNNGIFRKPSELVVWAGDYLAEFQHSSLALSPYASKRPPASAGNWIPPPSGSLKLNTDASVHPEVSVIGLGAVIRDHCGKIISAVSKPLRGCYSAEVGEFLALREGLLLAKQHKLSVHLAEVDASNVASALNSSVVSFGDACNVIFDIKALFQEVGVLSCLAIPRCGNSMAHNLASLAFSSEKESCWLNFSPPVSFPFGG